MDGEYEAIAIFENDWGSTTSLGAAGVIQEGIAVDPLLAECELEAHDLYQAQLDCLKSGIAW